MGCYKVLSNPISNVSPLNYKGLYRSEPFPSSNANEQFISLWQRYTQYLEPLTNMGITQELLVGELKDLANLATQDSGEHYEVIFFDENFNCLNKSNYYGIDVVGIGGYSLIGEGLLNNSKKKGVETYHLIDVINQHFRAKLNTNCLFSTIDDAISFREVLNEWQALIPGSIETENWTAIHVFKVI